MKPASQSRTAQGGRGTDAAFRAAIDIAGTGDHGRAIALLEALHRTDARHPGVRNALGVLRLERGDSTGALALLKPLAHQMPDAVGIQLNFGNALVAAGRATEAIVPLRRAASRDPGSALAQYGYARALQHAGRIDEALAAYDAVLRIDPGHVAARASRAAACNFIDRYRDGESEARAAIAIAPHDGGAHLNLAMSLLAQGRWAEGWAKYEWRDRTGLLDGARRAYERPRWDGGDIAGCTVLVHAEQGFGDTIQFVRYLPVLRERGARVVLQCPASLVTLLADAALADSVIAFGDPIPPHDLQVPLTGLPHRLRCWTDAEVLAGRDACTAPYLRAPARRTLALPAAMLRVGIVWAGSPTHVNDMHRSCGLAAFEPLLATPGVQWVSLQTGARAGDIARLPRALTVHDPSAHLNNFADTASVIEQLDVVISVDSAVAHLAGAMGKPCWLLLPRIGLDWRWAADSVRERWYPALWPVRQSVAGEWSDVMAIVRERLERCMESRATSSGSADAGG